MFETNGFWLPGPMPSPDGAWMLTELRINTLTTSPVVVVSIINPLSDLLTMKRVPLLGWYPIPSGSSKPNTEVSNCVTVSSPAGGTPSKIPFTPGETI